MSTATAIYLATGNAHKVEEIADMLATSVAGVGVHSAKSLGGMPEVDETGETFVANARLKAEALLPLLPEGAYALADDSGLCVDALGGAPGVISARYSGLTATDADNNAKLLRELADVPTEQRTAQFVCVFCLLGKDGSEQVFEGACPGKMIDAPRGENGFGYDPLFVPDSYTRTFAELGAETKNRISHRARAVERLAAWLAANLG
ncbi:MAG: RdgB/HAM1 family non-canonical purine NTP pyrophosphatase [Verrucomicrobiota bacterium]